MAMKPCASTRPLVNCISTAPAPALGTSTPESDSVELELSVQPVPVRSPAALGWIVVVLMTSPGTQNGDATANAHGRGWYVREIGMVEVMTSAKIILMVFVAKRVKEKSEVNNESPTCEYVHFSWCRCLEEQHDMVEVFMCMFRRSVKIKRG